MKSHGLSSLLLLVLATGVVGLSPFPVPRGVTAVNLRTWHPDSLALIIRELRQQGQFADALLAARRRLEVLREDPAAQPWDRDDAERLVALLAVAAELPTAARRELAEADLLDARISELWRKQAYGQAGDLVRHQLEIRERILGESNQEVARNYSSLAYYRSLQGRKSEAADCYQRALEIYQDLRIRDHPAVVYILKYLGTLLYGQGDYERVLPLWEERLATVRRLYGEEHTSTAEAAADLGELYRKTGDYTTAEPLQIKALAIRRALLGDEDSQTVGSIYNLALLYHNTGDYAVAEHLHLRAISLYRKLLPKDHPKIVRSLEALAVVRTDLGELGDAEPLFREVLSIRRQQLPEAHHDVARTLNNLAMLLYQKENFEEAESLFRKALDIKRNIYGEAHPEILLNMHNLALCQTHLGRMEEAEALLREELDLTVRTLGEENRSIAECYHDLGRNLVGQGKYAEAEDAFEKALHLYRIILGDEHPYVALALADIALGWTAQDEFAVAESLLAEAADIYEAARRRVGTGFVRSTFQESPYWLLAAARLETGRGKQAWVAVEGALGRALADLLLASGKQIFTPGEGAREDSLLKTLGQLQDRLAALQAATRKDSAAETVSVRERTYTRLLETEAAWKGFQIEMARKYPVTAGRGYALERVQRVLSESTALIGWLHVETAPEQAVAWGYVIRPQGPVNWIRLGDSYRTDVGFAEVFKAQDFRRKLRRAASWPARVPVDDKLGEEAKEICDFWFAPLKPSLTGVENLIVIPAGPLLGVPLSSLIDTDGAYLDETYTISYAPSATVYTWLCEGETRAARAVEPRTLLVGNPAFAEESASLSWVEEEVQRVASVAAGATTLLGPAASEQHLFRLAESDSLQNYDLVHFATHAHVDDNRPNRSALILSNVALPDPLAAVTAGTRLFDGRLTADEIVREWHLSADLVTLSGCQTALGKEHAGEGFIGLAHAFLQAGARSLVTSLWRVEDESTAMLMQRFYANLLGAGQGDGGAGQGTGMSKAAALREAKRWLRNYINAKGEQPFAHPAYWSGFVLSGKP